MTELDTYENKKTQDVSVMNVVFKQKRRDPGEL